ncbi:hypothetical protein [Luedemannella helvata]|uniref:Uncharacterized protein n=1 Tax=Luedemannella helvata TaxID=349315 RepID=A0ABN2L4D3_9ACTN
MPRRLARMVPSSEGSRLAPFLVAAAVAVASIVALVARPATTPAERQADYVIIAGAPGLRWDDLSPTETPALWQLAARGSIGALAVRSARGVTCPADGWLTLGAGKPALRTGIRAAARPTGTARPGPTSPGRSSGAAPTTPPATTAPPEVDSAIGCYLGNTEVFSPDSIGGLLPDQPTVVSYNEGLTWGARPGALAESMRCTVAVGAGAAVAAARPIGRVDRYAAALPADPAPLLRHCVLSIVDLGVVAGDGDVRRFAVREADARMARVLAARPPGSLVLAAGLADTDETSRLHVAIADGPGYAGGWLSSPSTSRSGYLQLIDLAPTALAALGKQHPARLFAGQPANRTEGRPDDLAAAVRRLADADREAGAQRDVSGRFFVGLAVVALLAVALAVPLLRQVRRGIGPRGPRAAPAGLRRAAEMVLIAIALAIPAALVAGLTGWWHTAAPAWVFLVGLLVALTLGVAVSVLSPARRHTLGPTGAAAGLAAVVVLLDVLTGTRLQLNGVGGYSALEGARYAGLGTVGLGVFSAGLLLAAGCVAQRLPRRWRPACVAVLGGIGVMVVGSPYLGTDAAGAISLTAGVCVAAAMSTGGWLTVGRLSWTVLAGVVVTMGFALLDLRRPPETRGSLGRFLTAVQDGTAAAIVRRTNIDNVAMMARSPLAWLAIGAAVFAFVVIPRHWGGLTRLFAIYPAVRAAAAGLTVAVVLGGLTNGVGLTVAGAGAATALPLLVVAALRVLAHADERTGAAPPTGEVLPEPDPPEPAVPEQAGPPGDTVAGRPQPAAGHVLP